MKTAQKPYTVHFVCRGNTYRSRLAAAYFAGLVEGDRRFRVSSSGIGTRRANVQTVQKYTKALAKKHGLSHGITDVKQQTTNRLLAEADVIVFMNKDVYDDALKEYEFDTRKTLVWYVKDMADVVKYRALAERTEQALLDVSEGTFREIKRHCDQLHEYLTHTAWVDVVNKDNQLVGLRLPMAWVADRGLWHRGVHVIVQTSDGKYVVGKRTNTIVFAPGMLDISLGGGMDTGETPLQTASRETYEELGLQVAEKDFRPLFVYRQVSYHPHYRKQSKAHIYIYALTLPMSSPHFRLQPEEVAEVRLLSKRQVKHLLNTHRMTNFGRLAWGYKLYQKAVAYSTLPV